MVTDDVASQAVWTTGETGALFGLAEDAVAIEISTVSPPWIRQLAETVAARGIRFLEAPVVGTLPQAESGTLIVFAGGDPAVLTSAAPLLEAYAGAIHPVGPIGNGTAMKLVANMLLAAQIAGLAELLGFAERSGIAPQTAMDIIASLPAASPAAAGMGRLMVAGDDAPRFTAALMAKDLRYAAESASHLAADIPVSAAARGLFDRLIGLGDRNITAAVKSYSAGE
jgi:3-hydroxyisobutyrate dehydrogenase-like beta-hydroxyacid dehydrogenase